MTIKTAILVRRRVDFAAAAPTETSRSVISVRLAVQSAITALALPVVVDNGVATARVRAKKPISDCAEATLVRRWAIRHRRLAAARIVASVDDGTSAALRLSTVPLHLDRFLTAQVRPVVVDLVAATQRVPAVRAIHRRTVLTTHGSLVVERGPSAAQGVASEVLVFEHAVAADLDPVIVGHVSAASSVRTEMAASQSAIAADVPVEVIDVPATAAVCCHRVDVESTAGRVRTVHPVADGVVGAAEMDDGVVQDRVTAGRVASPQRSNTAAADALAPVVDDAVAATRVRSVLARQHALSPRHKWQLRRDRARF